MEKIQKTEIKGVIKLMMLMASDTIKCLWGGESGGTC